VSASITGSHSKQGDRQERTHEIYADKKRPQRARKKWKDGNFIIFLPKETHTRKEGVREAEAKATQT
jgi:hypothetical protein